MKKITFLLFFIPVIAFAQWTQVGGTINGETANDGSSNDIELNADGSILAIAASRNADAGLRAGHVRIYELNGSDWTQRGSDLDGSNEEDVFGSAIQISANGNVVAAGAPQFNVTPETPPGYVRVFEWNGSDWVQRGDDIIGSENRDNAGSAISLSADGNRIAIGANLNSEIGLFSGQTRIFEWDGSSWIQMGEDINGANEGDLSGGSVFLSSDGSKLFIGESAGSADGRIRTFIWDGTNWIEGLVLTDSQPGFGFITAIDETGNTLVAGGMAGSMSQGVTKIFEFDGTTWTQKGSTIEGDQGSDFLGFNNSGLSTNGNILILGALTGGAGYARIFEFDGSDWMQAGDDVVGEGDAVQFGRAVAMNADGDFVAVGTRINTGDNPNAGLVRTFENPTLSIEGVNSSTITYYPNPTQDLVHLRTSETIQTIEVYNVLGQLVISERPDKNIFDIDFSNQSSGIYLLQVRTAKGTEQLKIYKK